jgi:hypothetical protein
MTEQRMRELRARLAASRAQAFEFAQAIKHEEPPSSEAQPAATHAGGFPHSRLMRALMSPHAGIAPVTAALAVTVLRPRLLLSALRLAPMLWPLFMRHVLPRLLGQLSGQRRSVAPLRQGLAALPASLRPHRDRVPLRAR